VLWSPFRCRSSLTDWSYHCQFPDRLIISLPVHWPTDHITAISLTNWSYHCQSQFTFYVHSSQLYLNRECINPRHQVSQMTEFFTAVPSIGCRTELIFLHCLIFNEAVMFWKVAVLPSPLKEKYPIWCRGTQWCSGYGTALQTGRSGFDSRWCHWNFSVT
jgi:hypothetical protein